MLNYKILKQSDNTPWFVFLAGFTGTYEIWTTTCKYLSTNHDCSILLIDNLGAGTSPQPVGEYTTETMAQEVIKVICNLGLQDINLVGHSLGGAIAQKIALSQPNLVKKLFLLSTFAYLDKVARCFLQARYDLAKTNIDRRLLALSSIPSIFGQEFLANQENINLAIERVVSNPQTLDGMHGQLHACLTHDSRSELAVIKAPTVIISGRDDILVSYKHSEYLNTGILNSNLLIMGQAGHMLPLEQPQQLAGLLCCL